MLLYCGKIREMVEDNMGVGGNCLWGSWGGGLAG